MTNSVPEFESDTQCFLVIGSNTTEAHPLIAVRLLKAKRRGAQIIVLDPRRSQIAQWADIHYPFLLGTDVVVLNALAQVVVAEGLMDQKFVAERTENFEELKAALADYTPENMAPVCGIPADGLRLVARTYARNRPAAILYAMGVTQHTTGVDNVKSIANLSMLTGNIGVPGSGVNPLRGQNNVQGACDMGALPNVYPGYQPVTALEVQKRFQEAWGAAGPLTAGLTVTEMVNALASGELRALYVMGENPMLSDPDLSHVRRCLAKAEFLVVQDIFLTETARLAHVVLPAVSFAEKEGTFTNTERRVQRVRQAIPPLGGAWPDWQIICRLAQKLGARGFDFDSPQAIMEEVARLTPTYGGINYARLDALGSLQWPCPALEHPGTPYLHKDKFIRGKGRFFTVAYKPPVELPDAEYPLRLTTGRLMFHYHTGTMTRRSPKLDNEVRAPYVEINPADARQIGLTGRRRVRVSSRRGQIELEARVTEDIMPGVVFIPFHFAEAAANVLTNAAIDPVAKIPELKVCAVRVEVV